MNSRRKGEARETRGPEGARTSKTRPKATHDAGPDGTGHARAKAEERRKKQRGGERRGKGREERRRDERQDTKTLYTTTVQAATTAFSSDSKH